MGLRVLHMTLSFSRGGRREAIVRLAEALRRLDVICDVCSLTPFDEECQPARAAFEHSDAVRKRGLWDLGALARLRVLCHEWRPDVVHVHDAPSQFLAAALRVTSVNTPPIVMTFHRSLGLETERRRDRIRNAVSLTKVTAIVTGSAERQMYFRRMTGVPSAKVVRIPFGVDVSKFTPNPAMGAARRAELKISPDAFVCGTVGHFGPEKGVDVALRGFGELVRSAGGRQTHLIVMGDGPSERKGQLERIADEVAPGQVSFVGFRPDLEHWYPACDVLIHAPRLEAFGLAVAEAMACGVPVVGSAVGGVLDLVRDGVNGLLVPSEAPDRIGVELLQLMNDPPLRCRLAEAALRMARAGLAVELYAARYLALYQGLLTKRVQSPEFPAPSELPT